MATSLPVPIEFRLPANWRAADPDQVGVPGVAFVAVRPGSRISGFTTNITIDGHSRSDAASLSEIADESIDQLQLASHAVSLSQRSEFGSAEAPGLTQVVRVRTVQEGTTRQLVQCQVYLAMEDTTDPGRRAVIRLVLTAPDDQFDSIVGEFQEFVSTIRPDTSSGSATTAG